MHNSFGNAFVIEVRDLLPQNEIFEQGWTAIAGLERVLIVIDANALIRGQELAGAVFSILRRSSSFASSAPYPAFAGKSAACFGLADLS